MSWEDGIVYQSSWSEFLMKLNLAIGCRGPQNLFLIRPLMTVDTLGIPTIILSSGLVPQSSAKELFETGSCNSRMKGPGPDVIMDSPSLS
ncbi:uncharacterized protein PHALS_09744 [Plasmopara halstedii]|uniref:Uncharacterized protein n=1 Tax=Plasmopara halstedii TaxID=4781 RepID=A0A0P1AFW5_PLAHL|nr:uncharacterized protein PHALS_09744 [Plasmopara halstedii]CEG39501.1 hypothetical protein PHALS_09744 [Plasmopara halstedii]|eukprot:XP_024575870.1 hypothetical protein PHALS_09744 [Plasmopara halstedii]